MLKPKILKAKTTKALKLLLESLVTVFQKHKKYDLSLHFWVCWCRAFGPSLIVASKVLFFVNCQHSFSITYYKAGSRSPPFQNEMECPFKGWDSFQRYLRDIISPPLLKSVTQRLTFVSKKKNVITTYAIVVWLKFKLLIRDLKFNTLPT